MIQNYIEYIKESDVKLDGRYGFHMFLELIDDLKCHFIKSGHFLNTGRFLYFFTTENIKSKTELAELFDNVQSVKITSDTIETIKDKRISFYFGVRDRKLEYGFQDDMTDEIYKTGQFDIDNRFLKSLNSYKCLVLIDGVLKNSNIISLSLLHEIRTAFKDWFPEFTKTTIMKENMLKKVVEKDKIKDFGEVKLLHKYEQWCEKFKWINKVFYYIDYEDDKVVFYIKVKPKTKKEED